jgi:hypothetical protein
MNKFIFTILILFSSLILTGQINPVNDLYFQQNYMNGNYNCPSFNCFELSWITPESSNDTLLGYNVYRNNYFWIFTNETIVSCAGIAPCGYSDFYDSIPFWVTVKAIYNSDSIISLANDSVYAGDLFVNVDEIEKDKLNLSELISIYPNPAQKEIFISVENGITIDKINIYNQLGQNVIHQISFNGSIDVSSLLPGIYFVEVLVGDEQIRERLILR